MTDDENCQPRSGVIGTKMTIRFAACGTAVYDFEVVAQQPALTASRALPERALIRQQLAMMDTSERPLYAVATPCSN